MNNPLLLDGGNTIFNNASSWMRQIYKDIAGITLVAAACCAAVCLFLIIFSKNQKTVDSSVAWLKRIAIGAVAILAMNFIVSYVVDGLHLSTNTDLTVEGTAATSPAAESSSK